MTCLVAEHRGEVEIVVARPGQGEPQPAHFAGRDPSLPKRQVGRYHKV